MLEDSIDLLYNVQYIVNIYVMSNLFMSGLHAYLSGRCCCILAMSPMLGSERMYMVARIAMTTNSHEEGLAGYTPLITLF